MILERIRHYLRFCIPVLYSLEKLWGRCFLQYMNMFVKMAIVMRFCGTFKIRHIVEENWWKKRRVLNSFTLYNYYLKFTHVNSSIRILHNCFSHTGRNFEETLTNKYQQINDVPLSLMLKNYNLIYTKFKLKNFRISSLDEGTSNIYFLLNAGTCGNRRCYVRYFCPQQKSVKLIPLIGWMAGWQWAQTDIFFYFSGYVPYSISHIISFASCKD